MGTESKSRVRIIFFFFISLPLVTLIFLCREDKIELARFQGRPGELSPKARFFLLLGRLMPSRFKQVPRFSLSFTCVFFNELTLP